MMWRNAFVATDVPGAMTLVCSPEGFLADVHGVLFPQQWAKSHDFSVLGEQGIGYLGDEPVLLQILAEAKPVEGCQWLSLRHFMLEEDATTYAMLRYGAQVATWFREHRFCGGCGAPTRQAVGERAMRCEVCRTQHYPRLAPSMIALVTRGDEILLARSPRFVPGIYSTLAGFVEPGESAEECVCREVREEVGLEITNIQYIGSQNWPFPHSLMLGFHAEYLSGEIVRQVDEIEDARWFRVDQLPPMPAARSIARYLIDLYVARRLGLTEPRFPA